jgi:hypothetical protein
VLNHYVLPFGSSRYLVFVSDIPSEHGRARDTERLYGMFPWERARLSRVLDLTYAHMLEKTQAIERRLASPSQVAIDIAEAANADLVLAMNGAIRRDWDGDSLVEYIQTTPAIRDAIDLEVPATLLARAGAVEVDTVALRRMQLVALALYGWKHDHPKMYPQKLAELAPTSIQSVPLDPWSGREFRFWPHGQATGVIFDALTVEPGEPYLEAMGPYANTSAPTYRRGIAGALLEQRDPIEDVWWVSGFQRGMPVVGLPDWRETKQ